MVDANNYIYVVLSGSSSVSNSVGIAKLSFDGNSLIEEWITTSSDFNTLHGVAINDEYVYVSGRGDGNIYQFDSPRYIPY
mgnify:CR=1 FL=1